MLIQNNSNTQDFQGKIFVNKDLSKKHKKLISTIRPYINNAIADKDYNLYYGQSFNKIEIGVAKKAQKYYDGYIYDKKPNVISRIQSPNADLLMNKSKYAMEIYEKKLASGKYETFGEKCTKFFHKIGEKIYNFLTK